VILVPEVGIDPTLSPGRGILSRFHGLLSPILMRGDNGKTAISQGKMKFAIIHPDIAKNLVGFTRKDR